MRATIKTLNEQCNDIMDSGAYALSYNRYVVDYCETTLVIDQPLIDGIIHTTCGLNLYSRSQSWKKEEQDSILEDQVRAMVNSTGDFVKSISDTLDYSVALAQTHAKAESSNTSAYAGTAFGVIGIAATLALVSTCNKKSV